jgi:DNA-binding protein H-NS
MAAVRKYLYMCVFTGPSYGLSGAIAAEAGFKIGDLFGGRGGKGRKVAAKYANPNNPSETWTGRGRKPRWLAAKIKAGEKQEKFLLK